MPAISTGVGLALAAGIGGATSLASGAMGASAAGHAADAQSQGAMYAADKQKQAADEALAFQKQQYATGQQELAPWLGQGAGALANLSNLLGIPVQGNATIPGAAQPALARGNTVPTFGGMNIGPTMRPGGIQYPGMRSPMGARGELMDMRGGALPAGTVPTNPGLNPTHQVSLQSLINPQLGAKGSLMQSFKFDPNQDPGYQFRLQQGMDAIQRSAAARGGVLSGGTAKALNDYAQGSASDEYMNSYNRFVNDQTTKYNRLAQIAGIGQQTAGQLVSSGQRSADSIGNLLLASGNAQAQGINDAAAARGSGYLNSAGAWGGALNGITGNLSQLLLMRQLFPQQGPASVPYGQYQPQPYLGIGS